MLICTTSCLEPNSVHFKSQILRQLCKT